MSALTWSPLGLEPHDKRWPHRGAQLAAALRAALGPLALRIDHIGGTSIPGLAARPVFDLQVSVRQLASAALDEPLSGLGLRRLAFEADRIVPAGRRDDRRRWAKRCWGGPMSIRDASRPGDATRDEQVLLHVRGAGAPNERLALLLRDWFRAHPEVGLASFDMADPVMDLVAVTAEAWADRTGWRP